MKGCEKGSAVPSLMFIGGFLGAGKTAAIQALGKILARRGWKASAVTNDQAVGLVDTAYLRTREFIVREVAGSCFCCNFNGMLEAITRNVEEGDADIVLSEPVGSCTDIVATVIRPLKDKMPGARILTYSVMVEPQRWEALSVARADEPESMRFLFEKQLEEADFIVVSKSDLFPASRMDKILAEIRFRYSQANVISVSSKTGAGLENWLDLVLVTPPGERWLKDIDYDRYAKAEAEMGWLNAQMRVKFATVLDGNAFAVRMVDRLRQGVAVRNGRIGNLKVLAVGDRESIKCGTSLVDGKPDPEGRFSRPLDQVSLTVNVRATLSPEDLSTIVRDTADFIRSKEAAEVEITYLNTFRPTPPKPTYRYA